MLVSSASKDILHRLDPAGKLIPWFDSVTNFCKQLTTSIDLDFPNTAAQSSSDLTVAVPGAGAKGFDFVDVAVPAGSILPNSAFTAFVSAPDVVKVRFHNYSSGAQNPASGTFQLRVTRN